MDQRTWSHKGSAPALEALKMKQKIQKGIKRAIQAPKHQRLLKLPQPDADIDVTGLDNTEQNVFNLHPQVHKRQRPAAGVQRRSIPSCTGTRFCDNIAPTLPFKKTFSLTAH